MDTLLEQPCIQPQHPHDRQQVRELQEKRRVLEQQPVKTEKDMLDLSLLAFFAGDSDKALGYLLQATEKK